MNEYRSVKEGTIAMDEVFSDIEEPSQAVPEIDASFARDVIDEVACAARTTCSNRSATTSYSSQV